MNEIKMEEIEPESEREDILNFAVSKEDGVITFILEIQENSLKNALKGFLSGYGVMQGVPVELLSKLRQTMDDVGNPEDHEEAEEPTACPDGVCPVVPLTE